MQYTVLYSPVGGMESACYGRFDSCEDAQAYIDLIHQPAGRNLPRLKEKGLPGM